jgi:hypothetical protein
MSTIKRRKFLRISATAVSSFMIVPRHVLGGKDYTPPSDKLNIAAIGVAGQGASDLENLESENIVSLCDVDWVIWAYTISLLPFQL